VYFTVFKRYILSRRGIPVIFVIISEGQSKISSGLINNRMYLTGLLGVQICQLIIETLWLMKERIRKQQTFGQLKSCIQQE